MRRACSSGSTMTGGNLLAAFGEQGSSFPRHSIWQVARVRPTGQCAQ